MSEPTLPARRARFLVRVAAPALLGASVGLCASAQTAPAPRALPDAGSILQQLQPDTSLAPSPTIELPELGAQRAAPAPAHGGPAFEVKGFRLLGVTDAEAAELLPLIDARIGRGRTLRDLEDAAKDLEAALQRRGLFLAQVCVPAQTLAGGIVTLQVYEGRLGELTLDVAPDVKVSTAFLESVVAPLRGHPLLERGLVERVLLTLGDLRAIAATSSLAPGKEIGEADLTIHVRALKGDAIGADFDNAGSTFTGRPRYYANMDWFNLADRGDVASVRTQASSGSQFFRASWMTPVDGDGDKVGISSSYLVYHLGTPLFYPLQADGDASTWGVMALHPAIRSRNQNLFVQASLETRYFEDRVRAIDLDDKKGVTVYANLGLTGDFRDTAGGGGISNWSAQLVLGHLSLDTPSEAALDAQTYRSAGNYTKLVLSAARLQSLPNKDYLYLSAQAQLASKNLDSSEKFNVGGLYGLRAYPSPESPSDEALLWTWEYRKPIALGALPGDFVFSVFGDYGVMRQHVTPQPGETGNVRKLMGHGIGLTRTDDAGLTLRVTAALRGQTTAQSDDQHTRILFQASKQF